MFNQISQSTDILHAALNGLNARQNVISNNIANADTPGYSAQTLDFEGQLQRDIEARKRGRSPHELSTTHGRHYERPGLKEPHSMQDLLGQMSNDGNGVDMEQEIVNMAQAQLSYTTVSQLVAGRFSSLKYVINEGGR